MNTQELHVALFDGEYQVSRFVAESSSMNNIFAASVNLAEHSNHGLKSDDYWVEVRDTNGKYVTRVKQNRHTKKYMAGFITEEGFQLEWHEINELLNPDYNFKYIKSL